MKKIIFINPGPFGSLTDTYYYYIFLKEKYDLTYIGFDEGKKTQKYDGIKIIHLAGAGNNIKKKYLFYENVYTLLKSNYYDCIFINYFVGCSLLRLFAHKNVILDIRTSCILSNKYKRFLFNLILFCEIKTFKNISIISESLNKYLYLTKRTHILPLGAPSFPLIKKDFNNLRILYVGTFHERNIVNTIYAFSKFLSSKEDKSTAQYTIIGNGTDLEIKNIQEAITFTGMEKHITYKGIIRYPELIKYLNKHNIGMSYIPIKSYFDNQPPTKTFEYLLSGMAVIATGTKENKNVITNKNGIIIRDTIEDIMEGLQYIFINRLTFNSEQIQQDSQKYSWESIVNKNLIPFIESL